MHIYTVNWQEKNTLRFLMLFFLEDQITCTRKSHHHFLYREEWSTSKFTSVLAMFLQTCADSQRSAPVELGNKL